MLDLNFISNHISSKTPFVAFSEPNYKKVTVYTQKNSVLTTFTNQNGFVFAGFNKERYVFETENCIITEHEMEINYDGEFSENNIVSNDKEKVFFENLVEKAVTSINDNNFEKVVLSRKIEIIEEINIEKSFLKLLTAYPTAFCYIWYHPEVGMWMGATPEQLVKIENNSFETVALAGTKLFNQNEVAWGEKEIIEQKLVIDYIEKRLQNHTNNCTITAPFTQQAGHLVHLKSVITGNLNEKTEAIAVVNALHPTSAVCGMPLTETKNFIVENENYDRSFYTGFLGEFNTEKTTNLFVNLRCAAIQNNKTIIYVGCGITKDSQPEKEFIETENKAKTIGNILVLN